jgi:hypothetical protein
MKKLFLFLLHFSSISAFGQDMKAIERDLLDCFRQIDSFKQLEYETQENKSEYKADYGDSAEVANDRFAKKLVYYTSAYPQTLAYDFPDLQKVLGGIASSADHKFRIYSWDNEQGGTERFYENVIQYQGDKIQSIRLKNTDNPETGDENEQESFSEVFKPEIGIPGIYIAYFHAIESSKYSYDGIRCFKIEGNTLIDTFQLFKTEDGLTHEIGLEFDWGKTKREDVPEKLFYWADQGKTLKIPFVNDEEQVSSATYRFTGKYYEKDRKK